MEDVFPFHNISDSSEWDPYNSNGSIFDLLGLEKPEEEREEGKTFDFDNPYYDVKSGSREKPPDEPVNILAIPYAKMYKVDGSNTDPDNVVCLQKFRPIDVLVLGCCNGLLGLYHHPGDFFLINPSTGKENLVRVPKEECDFYYSWNAACAQGICHDSDNGEYKAVIFLTNYLSFHVVNFKNKSWKCKIQHQLPLFSHFGSDFGKRTGTVVKGVPYWLCEASSGYMVIYFDFKAEEFRVVPNLPNQGKRGALGSLDGKLCLSSVTSSRLEFWNLEKTSNGVSSWSLWHVSTLRVCEISTLSWMSRHDEVLVSVGELLMVYNVREQSLRLLSKKVLKMLKRRVITLHPIVTYSPSWIDPTQ